MGHRHYPLDHIWRKGRLPRRPGLVMQKAVHAFLHESLLPTPYRRFGLARPAHDPDSAKAVRRQGYDPRSPDMLLKRLAIGNQRFQPGALGRRNFEELFDLMAMESHGSNRLGVFR